MLLSGVESTMAEEGRRKDISPQKHYVAPEMMTRGPSFCSIAPSTLSDRPGGNCAALRQDFRCRASPWQLALTRSKQLQIPTLDFTADRTRIPAGSLAP
jgi:hypothetical protein